MKDQFRKARGYHEDVLGDVENRPIFTGEGMTIPADRFQTAFQGDDEDRPTGYTLLLRRGMVGLHVTLPPDFARHIAAQLIQFAERAEAAAAPLVAEVIDRARKGPAT